MTLDTGHCPPWLFRRMVHLGREMTRVMVDEYGPDEFIRRIADPVWFQSLGTALAFDWNESGLTTILTAALKEAIRGEEQSLGVFICGGKGKTSRRTPDEILSWGRRLRLADGKTDSLVYNSKMAARVDSALIQDGFQIYHHSFFFSRGGHWAVVQQGMNAAAGSARRYHWYSAQTITDDTRTNAEGNKSISVDQLYNPRQSASIDFVNEPHTGIMSDRRVRRVLNLTAGESGRTRDVSTELVSQNYGALMKDIEILRRHSSPLSQMIKVKRGEETLTMANLEDKEFRTHPAVAEDFAKSRYLEKILSKLTSERPENYEKLLATEGVGPKTVRALALVSEVIYGAEPSYKDPARYSFAHGGKDATPYPVDRETYDRTIVTLRRLVFRTRLSLLEKQKIEQRLRSVA
ncbi:DUF763 domain-containing protein [Candidatus Wolfebacteria bacterium]|nr:DUF763 domain-containing protein [Candidatus Wolfebacteria bacterium]